MKIQCDVCSKAEAAVFCTADEAALCGACDHRVHHANKLASKHHRFSLYLPSSKHFPLCDICQEKRAFLFCQQDRAILCRDCDHPIHAANEHTQKHNRFLLTGVKLSDKSTVYDNDGAACPPMPNNNNISNNNYLASDPKTKPVPISNQPKNSSSSSLSSTATTKAGGNLENSLMNGHGGVTSSISEYLIETLPGWHVEDFLDNCKADDGLLMPFLGCELDENSNNNNNNSASSLSSENMGIWVPQAPPAPLYPSEMGKVLVGTFKDTNHKEATNLKALNYNSNMGISTARRWSDDGSFTVPQMNFPSSGSKRSRTFW